MNSSKLQTKVTSMGKNAEHCMNSSKLQTKVTSMGKNAEQYFKCVQCSLKWWNVGDSCIPNINHVLILKQISCLIKRSKCWSIFTGCLILLHTPNFLLEIRLIMKIESNPCYQRFFETLNRYKAKNFYFFLKFEYWN